ncbi:MAG: hypothetical protein SFV15_14995 [Polyangiaceae bacterium]|nr:hypothetical protein [Polyangiaceae bacterium]
MLTPTFSRPTPRLVDAPFILTFWLLLPASGCEQQRPPSEAKVVSGAMPTAPLPRPRPKAPPGPLEVPNSQLPPDVDVVLKHKCRRCHTTPPANGAPFPLLTWEDTQKLRYQSPIWKFIGSTVKSGFMPYRIPLDPPVERLTENEKKILLDWVQMGAPRATFGPDLDPGSAGAGTLPPRKTTL